LLCVCVSFSGIEEERDWFGRGYVQMITSGVLGRAVCSELSETLRSVVV
jgi:hypothetical protein